MTLEERINFNRDLKAVKETLEDLEVRIARVEAAFPQLQGQKDPRSEIASHPA